jgi:hypothetical protein
MRKFWLAVFAMSAGIVVAFIADPEYLIWDGVLIGLCAGIVLDEVKK